MGRWFGRAYGAEEGVYILWVPLAKKNRIDLGFSCGEGGARWRLARKGGDESDADERDKQDSRRGIIRLASKFLFSRDCFLIV